MAKVGLKNDTLRSPKCPSNWEYSTGQRQLLDIQSGEQMDRLSFWAIRSERYPASLMAIQMTTITMEEDIAAVGYRSIMLYAKIQLLWISPQSIWVVVQM